MAESRRAPADSRIQYGRVETGVTHPRDGVRGPECQHRLDQQAAPGNRAGQECEKPLTTAVHSTNPPGEARERLVHEVGREEIAECGTSARQLGNGSVR